MGMMDLIIIGGGINGAGIARDAALRGLNILLLDKGDFGSGASNGSSGFIHGGARYLTQSLQTTRQSCIDSGIIQKIAPHLVFRIPFLYPVKSRWQGLLVEGFFSAYDVFSRYRNGKPHCWLNRRDLRDLLPGVSREFHGAVTFDEWSVQPHRLVMGNIIDAVRHGAEVHNYCEASQLVTEIRGGRRAVTGVVAMDRLTGECTTYHTRMVCNATGPWAMHFASQNGLRLRLRPAKGLHVVIPRRLFPFGVMCHAMDGRLIFFLPHSGSTIIGTTDDDTFQLPDEITPQIDEVAYLREGVAHVYPDIVQEKPGMTYWGVRPTLYARGQYEDDLSRAHRVFDHSILDGIDGVISLAGGKLATYRIMAEETTDVICRKLGVRTPCQTASQGLAGADPLDWTLVCPLIARIDPNLPRLLYHRYGSGIQVMEEMVQESPIMSQMLDAASLLTEVEVRYVVKREWVRTLADVGRRTSWGTSHVVSQAAALEVGRIVADELSWDGEQLVYEINRFIEAQERAVAPLAGWQAREVS
jgi:glycerol-3-phosphate dehydrogenase